MRGPSISQYASKIENLSASADATDEEDGGHTVIHDMTLDVVISLIRKDVLAVTKRSSLGDVGNFFDDGIDSLRGLQLVRALRRNLHRPDFALSMIYQNPTVPQLANVIHNGQTEGQDAHKTMENYLATYRMLLQEYSTSSNQNTGHALASGPINILLTGSTGTVGRYLLRTLLDRADIGRIYCLNRGVDGGKFAQNQGFASAEFSSAGLENRVTFIRADLQQPRLGLDQITYELLRTQVNLVVHAAWPVNFNLELSSFRSQLSGLMNLLFLTASTPFPRTRFIFMSSVSAVEGYKDGPPPETILDNFQIPVPLGYARSKFLDELLVDFGAKLFANNICATVIRVGQVAGPVMRPGLWNPNEWFPSMILSSLHMGMVPDSLGPFFDKIDFVPVDLLANILVDLATTESVERATSGASVYNLRNL